MIQKVYAVLLVALLVLPASLSAQTGTLTGSVTDEITGNPLPGANILIVGTMRGAASDIDGQFRIDNISAGTYTFRVTFVGYKNLEREITISAGQQTVDFAMAPDLLRMDEVVVTALGILREEKSIGYSVQNVSGEALVGANESNLINALAAKAAGLQVVSSSGQPGKSSRVVIRGVTSMLGNNEPLFVIDGVPISNAEDEVTGGIENPLFTGGASNRGIDIDPNIIKDVTILKGASATALYGSRAASGAIIITTKEGLPGRTQPRVTFNSRFGWDNVILDGFQTDYTLGLWGYYRNGLPFNRGGYSDPQAVDPNGNPIPATATQTTVSWGPHKDEIPAHVLADLGVDKLPVFDPRADFYRRASVSENSVSITGGSRELNYFTSLSHLNQNGIVPGTSLDRTSILARVSGELSERLGLQTSINYINTNNIWMAEGNSNRSFLYGLNFAPINFDIRDYQYEDGTQRYSTTAFNNPFWLVKNNRYTSDVERIIGSTQISYRFTPNLVLTERISVDQYVDTRKEELNVGTISRPEGSMFDQTLKRRELNSDLTLTYDRRLNRDFGLNVMVGNNINTRQFKRDIIRGTTLNIPGYFHVNNASVVTGSEYSSETRLVSLFSQVIVDYREYLYVTLTGRNDWSSTLPKDNNSYFYPSLSVGYVFTEAFDFFRNTPLNYGRLRGAVSQIGNDAPVYSLRTNFIQAAPGDGVRGVINYPFDGVNAYKLSRTLGNPALKPEISTEYEFGFDLRFFDGRARIDAAYYDRSTRDQIFTVPVSPTTGFSSMLMNAGEIRNYGYEVSLHGVPLQTRNFRWDFQVNYSKNTTDVVELYEGVTAISLGGFTSANIRILPGKNNYGVIWSTAYRRDDQGRLLINDAGFPILEDTLSAIGRVTPDWLGNLRSTISYKGLSLSALVDVRQGGDIYNMDLFYTVFYGTAKVTEQRNTHYTYEGVNVNTGEVNDVEIYRDEVYWRNFYSEGNENFVEDGSFIKLREITLSYTLPRVIMRHLPVSGATLSATGRNLWIKSDFSYGDPEGSLLGSGNAQGFYHMVAPSTKGFSFSLNVNI